MSTPKSDLPPAVAQSETSQISETLTLESSLLLKYVFNADPKSVNEFLSQHPQKTSVVLTRTTCSEEYFNPSTKNTLCKRVWKNISPLEAAAWCGDNFLVKVLLSHVPASQGLEAAQQLQGILERKETEEHGGYLAPFKALIIAYQEYTKFVISEGVFKGPKPVWDFHRVDDTLKQLWSRVWEKQRALPTYGLQEFCDDKPFDPPPAFDEEPKRSCLYYDKHFGHTSLDLNTNFGGALCKLAGQGYNASQFNLRRNMEEQLYCREMSRAAIICFPHSETDCSAIEQLCEVRAKELANIIKELRLSIPLPPVLKQEKDMATLQASFLDTKDLVSVYTTCKQFQIFLNTPVSEKKKQFELLHHVKKVKELLADMPLPPKTADHCIALTNELINAIKEMESEKRNEARKQL